MAHKDLEGKDRSTYNKKYYAKNKERRKSKDRDYYAANRDRIRDYQKRNYRANRDAILAKQRAYDATRDPEARRTYLRQYRARSRDRLFEQYLRKTYGIGTAEMQAQLALQGGKCAVPGCRGFGKKPPNVDHDHQTGRLRGILCQRHNRALGLFADDPAGLRFAAGYVERGGDWGRTPTPSPATETSTNQLSFKWVDDA